MKKYLILLVAIFSIAFTNCKKDEITPEETGFDNGGLGNYSIAITVRGDDDMVVEVYTYDLTIKDYKADFYARNCQPLSVPVLSTVKVKIQHSEHLDGQTYVIIAYYRICEDGVNYRYIKIDGSYHYNQGVTDSGPEEFTFKIPKYIPKD